MRHIRTWTGASESYHLTTTFQEVALTICDRNYDWKLVEDDCRFVMRKGYHECTTANGVYSFKGFDYTYRCVHYKAWGVNIGKN
jgi:hypothetical protein